MDNTGIVLTDLKVARISKSVLSICGVMQRACKLQATAFRSAVSSLHSSAPSVSGSNQAVQFNSLCDVSDVGFECPVCFPRGRWRDAGKEVELQIYFRRRTQQRGLCLQHMKNRINKGYYHSKFWHCVV